MLTQLPSVPSLIPSSFATRAIGRDVSITIFTASSLNSGEKLFFGRGNYFTFPDGPSYWMDCPEGSGHLTAVLRVEIAVVVDGDLEVAADGVLGLRAELAALAGVVRSWVGRDRGRKVTVRIGEDSLEVTRASEREQAQLIEAWLGRH